MGGVPEPLVEVPAKRRRSRMEWPQMEFLRGA